VLRLPLLATAMLCLEFDVVDTGVVAGVVVGVVVGVDRTRRRRHRHQTWSQGRAGQGALEMRIGLGCFAPWPSLLVDRSARPSHTACDHFVLTLHGSINV